MKRNLPPFAALRAFEAVVRLQSFKDAAHELNVTPSAISHQLRRLEDEVGCRLMRRDRNGVELTPQGQRYASIVTRAMERIAEATSELRWEVGACLTLQAYSTFTIRWLLGRLPDYESATGQPPVRLVTSQLDVDLASEPVDACIFIGHPTRSDVDYTYLFSSRVFPVCSPDYLAAAPPLREPSDLRAHTVLQVYPSAEDWSVWLASAGVTGVNISGDSRFDSYDHALNAASRGLGVALAIEPFAEDDIASGRLVEPFPDARASLPRHWYFASLSSRRDLEKVSLFRDWLVDAIAADPLLETCRRPAAAVVPS
ncbi:LysR substrate-binding domain-containing protein [Marinicauda salina]|nr:LysR substrate-binding domain-containing protein [Marinicauda salina]